MDAETSSLPKPNCLQTPASLVARIDEQLTELEHGVAVLTAWQEFCARERRHDA